MTLPTTVVPVQNLTGVSNMTVYLVEYTDPAMLRHNRLLMEVKAKNLELARLHMDTFYPDLVVDQIYPAGRTLVG